jgi:hypothetical protein
MGWFLARNRLREAEPMRVECVPLRKLRERMTAHAFYLDLPERSLPSQRSTST